MLPKVTKSEHLNLKKMKRLLNCSTINSCQDNTCKCNIGKDGVIAKIKISSSTVAFCLVV